MRHRWLPFLLAWAFLHGLCHSASSLPETESMPSALAVELGAPFRDNAILQRGMPVPIWGWSKPDTRVAVTFGKQSQSAVAGPDGRWGVTLAPLKASLEPEELVVTETDGHRVVLKNILVGEVWIASGQSNMEEPVKNTNVGKVLLKGILGRVRTGSETPPVIREARVYGTRTDLAFRGYQPSPYPVERAPAFWDEGTDFTCYSSIAFAFAYDLHRALKVPVGILNCSVGATDLACWIPPEAIREGTSEYARALRPRVQAIYPGVPEHRQAWDRYEKEMYAWLTRSEQQLARHIPPDEPPTCPGNLDGNRNGIGWMYNGMMRPFVPYAIRGVIWNQGYNNRNDGLRYYDGLRCMIPGWRKAWGRPDLPVYLHQWFAGRAGNDDLGFGGTTEMRLSTWLAARDLPHTRMASMIDITGALHYQAKTVPGQRFARLALKYQYGRDLVADGPTFKSYRVDGNKAIVSFDHADGGLCVARVSRKSGISVPVVIKGGDDQITLFHVADKDCVWHRATMRIKDKTVLVSSPQVSNPAGVAYGALQGDLPGLYNAALLPTTPFMAFNQVLFTSRSQPGEPLKIADRPMNNTWSALRQKYSRLSLLGSQFRDNAVIQADQPTTFWGEAPGGSVVRICFAGTEKTVMVPEGAQCWEATVPARPAGNTPLDLHVTCEIRGEVAHEKHVRNIVAGDVWYVATSSFGKSGKERKKKGNKDKGLAKVEGGHPDVRLFTPFTRKRSNESPRRYRLEASGLPRGQFYTQWTANGEMPRPSEHAAFAYDLGAQIHRKTGKPVGILLMDTKGPVPIKSWISGGCLKHAPSLQTDYEAIKPTFPADMEYLSLCRQLQKDWKVHWQTFETTATGQLLGERKRAAGQDPFAFPQIAQPGTTRTEATRTYNMLVCAFGPANLKGILYLTPKSVFSKDEIARFGSEFSVLANCWKKTFASWEDPAFVYTLPANELLPAVTDPKGIAGKSHTLRLPAWPGESKQLGRLIKGFMEKAYP